MMIRNEKKKGRMNVFPFQDCGMQLTDEPDKRCYPLEGRLLCRSCHIVRISGDPRQQIQGVSASYQYMGHWWDAPARAPPPRLRPPSFPLGGPPHAWEKSPLPGGEASPFEVFFSPNNNMGNNNIGIRRWPLGIIILIIIIVVDVKRR